MLIIISNDHIDHWFVLLLHCLDMNFLSINIIPDIPTNANKSENGNSTTIALIHLIKTKPKRKRKKKRKKIFNHQHYAIINNVNDDDDDNNNK